MTKAMLAAGLVAAVAAGLGWLATTEAGAGVENEGAADRDRAQRSVLVELFTSQGCSSCPPADRLLSELAKRRDVDVVALSFHVDYWNYIGWTDPFSSAEWSNRQRRYAQSFGTNRIYTPQLVVDGRWEGVGSDRRKVAQLLGLAQEAGRQGRLTLTSERLSADRLGITVNTERFDPVKSDQLVTWVAVVEDGLETEVGRGENARKTLRNDRVVRSLERMPGERMEIELEAGWDRDRLSLVAFVQDAETLAVEAVAESELR